MQDCWKMETNPKYCKTHSWPLFFCYSFYWVTPEFLKPFALSQHLPLSFPDALRLHLQALVHLSQVSNLGTRISGLRSWSPKKWECLVQRKQPPAVAGRTSGLLQHLWQWEPNRFSLLHMTFTDLMRLFQAKSPAHLRHRQMVCMTVCLATYSFPVQMPR